LLGSTLNFDVYHSELREGTGVSDSFYIGRAVVKVSTLILDHISGYYDVVATDQAGFAIKVNG